MVAFHCFIWIVLSGFSLMFTELYLHKTTVIIDSVLRTSMLNMRAILQTAVSYNKKWVFESDVNIWLVKTNYTVGIPIWYYVDCCCTSIARYYFFFIVLDNSYMYSYMIVAIINKIIKNINSVVFDWTHNLVIIDEYRLFKLLMFSI